MIEQQARLGFSGRDVPPHAVFNQCVRCGLCLPTCPTYVETLVETSSPRGRIALIRAVAEGRLDVRSPGFVHQMSECLDCRACEAVCPSGVRYGELLEPARAQVVAATAPRRGPLERLARRALVGTLFAHPRLLRAAARVLAFYRRSGLQRLARASGLLEKLGLAALERFAPIPSPRFFVPRDQRYPAAGTKRATAFLHAGCIMSVAFAPWHEATVRVLSRNGIETIVPADQRCCGAITIHAGEPDRGRALAKQNIAAFERSGADVYAVNAAGCGSALKEYAHLLSDEPAWAERAAAFSARVRDVLEYLDEIEIAIPGTALAGPVTYQEPCHLAHAQRITAAPRRLLAKIPGLVLREMRESSLCCGSAGIYNVTEPAMSARLARRKLEAVLEVSPQIVATANPGCALQLRNALDGAGRGDIEVVHVVQLLDRAYQDSAAPV